MKTCARCGSKNLIKKGFTKAGRQRYKCKDCGNYSTMTQVVVYERVDYGKLCGNEEVSSKPRQKLSNEDAKVIFIYKFRFNVSEEDIAKHLDKPVEVIKDYVESYKKEQEKTKKLIDFGYKEKQLKHWLGIK